MGRKTRALKAHRGEQVKKNDWLVVIGFRPGTGERRSSGTANAVDHTLLLITSDEEAAKAVQIVAPDCDLGSALHYVLQCTTKRARMVS